MQRKKVYLILLSYFVTGFAHAQKNISVLFIGNSYTASNNLPNMLQQIGYTMGDSIFVDSYNPGGYSLLTHSQDANTINKINQQAWDYVVLQDQSQRPSFEPAYVDTAVIPYALFLDSVIQANNACTQTVFYMTWGRKYGDAGNCPFYPPVCTFAGMQQRLKESYVLMSDTCKGIAAPVGEAFKLSMQLDSNINLYISDNSHPSVAGTYLAACTFYATILHKQVINQNYTAGLSVSDAAFLQYVAWQTVRDSSLVWNLGVNEPFAYFNFQNLGNLQVQFSCPGNLNYNHLWYFGDTTYSTQAEPLHQYLYSYYFPVQHVVYDSCRYDSVSIIINAVGQLSVPEPHNYSFSCWYNKNTEQILFQFKSIQANMVSAIRVFDAKGVLMDTHIISSNEKTMTVDAGNILEGVYIIDLLTKSNETFRQKIIVIE